jgi:hypothetical protein
MPSWSTTWDWSVRTGAPLRVAEATARPVEPLLRFISIAGLPSVATNKSQAE